MALFQTNIGVEITDSALRIAQVHRRLGGVHMSRFEEIPDFASLSESGKKSAVMALSQKYKLQRAHVFVSVPRQWGVFRRIELPIEAAERVAAAVSLQIESLSPWTADEVYWDCASEKAAKSARTIETSVCIVPKSALDPYFEWFRLAGVTLAGASLSFVEAEVADDTRPAIKALPPAHAGVVAAALNSFGLNLIPAAERYRPNRFRLVPTYVLSAALILLGVFLVLREPYQWSVYAAKLDSEIAVLKPAVDAVAAQEEKLTKATAAYEFLRARVEARDANLEALRELSRSLPSDAWISGYNAQGRTVTISGFATSASVLQRVLEESAVFEEVQFASPVNRDSSGKDRFTIKATASPNSAPAVAARPPVTPPTPGGPAAPGAGR